MPGHLHALPVLSVDEKMLFLEFVVIPSFDADLGFTSSKERKDWINLRAQEYFHPDVVHYLARRFSVINTLEKAQEAFSLLEQTIKGYLHAVSIDEDIQFLEFVVIPFFDSDRELDTTQDRQGWVSNKTKETFGLAKASILLHKFSDFHTLEKAQEALSLLEDSKLQRLFAGEIYAKDHSRALLKTFEYGKSLDRLLDLIVSAMLPGPDCSIIESYRQGKRARGSDAYTSTVATPSTVPVDGRFNMCNFDISSLHGEFEVTVDVVTLSKDKLRTLLAGQLFNNSIDALDLCLAELTLLLHKLRSFFSFLHDEVKHFTEPSDFQPIYTLFLERVASRIGKSTCNRPGSHFPLSMDADVMLDNGSVENVTIAGKTDIVKVPTEDDDAFDAIEFLLELKLPFDSLFHKTSDDPKGQLVCQLLGLWKQSTENRSMVVGGLTDIFALMVCFAYAENGKRKFKMTKSVVDADDYLLHLMLLLCSVDCDVRDLVEKKVKVNAKPLRKAGQPPVDKGRRVRRNTTVDGRRRHLFLYKSEGKESFLKNNSITYEEGLGVKRIVRGYMAQRQTGRALVPLLQVVKLK